MERVKYLAGCCFDMYYPVFNEKYKKKSNPMYFNLKVTIKSKYLHYTLVTELFVKLVIKISTALQYKRNAKKNVVVR